MRFVNVLLASGLLLSGILVACAGGSGASSAPPSGGGGARTGSLSRFTIQGDHLYIVNKDQLQVYDLSDPEAPDRRGMTYVGFGIETLFSHENLLLIGSTQGLYLYDTVNPDRPSRLSMLPHARANDPVVAEGHHAYVTTYGARNELHIIDISNPSAPRLVRTYPMGRPIGLGVEGNRLFVCDELEGLKAYDTSQPAELWELDRLPQLKPLDLIAQDKRLVVTTGLGIGQYSYATFPMGQLSFIKRGS